ncbi:trypsin-like peptidase domain-containing protein [Bosea sp. LjRoot90]|uniref:trypsin-like peptidase domain-containing protein n=1 Tax=Bosea sp. LjRoot90 TaxID=3342342 RepID=UPI003F50BF2F
MITPESNNTADTTVRSPATARSILKRGAIVAGAATLSIGLMAGLADNFLNTHGAANAQPIQLSGLQQTQLPSFADVVDRVKPAVVSVRVKAKVVASADEESGPAGVEGLPPGHPLERFFRRFGEEGASPRGPQQQPRVQLSQGSGFFVSQDGYVVTNNHVVANAAEVQLVTDSGKTLSAKVIGTDPRTDLALLKVNESGNYPFVQLAAGKPRTGEWVLAVGNPFGLGGTVTAGIVSAQGRDIGSGPYDDFLQIDAAVNRGNSGGPTFNQKGEVVGVNTAIYSPSGGNVGIAFAIPAATVQSVVEQLKEHGSVARGFIGVQIQPVTAEVADAIGLKDAKGALIAEAQANGPAAKAGLKRGDTILAVNGEKIADARELSRKIATFAPGAKTSLTIWRDGKEREVSFEVGRQPAA